MIKRSSLINHLQYTIYTLSVLFVLFFISGCGRVIDKAVNPYHGEFACPQAERGKCIGIREAYSESYLRDDSLADLERRIRDMKKRKAEEKEQEDMGYRISLDEDRKAFDELDEITYIRKMYLSKLYDTILRSFGDTSVPLIIPPKVVRVVILPYTEGGVFYGKRQVFVVVDDYKWVLDQDVFDK